MHTPLSHAEWPDAGGDKHNDKWPADEPRAPPRDSAEALDPDGPWGTKACGVTIKKCKSRRKGHGAFATRAFRQGEVVGVYWGELITRRQFAIRHGWWGYGEWLDPETDLTTAERAAAERRSERLGALTWGAPVKGAKNGGVYCFQLWDEDDDEEETNEETVLLQRKRPAYVDGEDPTRSSWCRQRASPAPARRPRSTPHGLHSPASPLPPAKHAAAGVANAAPRRPSVAGSSTTSATTTPPRAWRASRRGSASCGSKRSNSSSICAMLCYAMLRYATLRYAMLCYAMLCYATLCYALLCYAVLCYAMLCYATLC